MRGLPQLHHHTRAKFITSLHLQPSVMVDCERNSPMKQPWILHCFINDHSEITNRRTWKRIRDITGLVTIDGPEREYLEPMLPHASNKVSFVRVVQQCHATHLRFQLCLLLQSQLLYNFPPHGWIVLWLKCFLAKCLWRFSGCDPHAEAVSYTHLTLPTICSV